MRLVIHAGMHKTGSSSIQATFAKLKRPGLQYAPSPIENHGGLYEDLTNDDPEKSKKFRKRGLSREQVLRRSAKSLEQFEGFLRNLSGTGILSAENISSPRTGDRAARLKEILDAHGVPAEVILYVRPPHSYMESAFQQVVKGGDVKELDPAALWPGYRDRVAHLDTVFGREKVTVRPFHPWEFPEKDAVRDFAEFVGVTLEPEEIRHTNEALSAEATALVFVQRKFGSGQEKAAAGIPRRNMRWTALLNGIGGEKLRFASSMVEPVIKANQADLDWIEERMGRKLEERRSGEGREISSELDLVKLGLQQLPQLEELLVSRIRTSDESRKAKAVMFLEALRLMS